MLLRHTLLLRLFCLSFFKTSYRFSFFHAAFMVVCTHTLVCHIKPVLHVYGVSFTFRLFCQAIGRLKSSEMTCFPQSTCRHTVLLLAFFLGLWPFLLHLQYFSATVSLANVTHYVSDIRVWPDSMLELDMGKHDQNVSHS